MTEQQLNTILVVDDSNTNVVLLEAVLADQGFNIKTAMNVKEAKCAIDKTLPSLILLDLLMPKVSGLEFLAELKSDKTLSSIPVIIVTALGSQETYKEALKIGANDFITKPIDVDILIEKVQKVLNK